MNPQTRNKLILFLTVFIDMLGFSVIFPIFPETLKFYLSGGEDPILSLLLSLIGQFESDSNHRYFIVIFGGLVGSIYAILQFMFAPFWGKLSDRTGRKPLLIFTSLGSFLGYLLWFFSTNFSLFVLSRIVTGIMGGNISVASAGMADITSEKDRAKGMGMIGAGIGLGFIFGPPLGGLLSGVDLVGIFPSLAFFGVTIFSSSALISVLFAFINLILMLTLFQESYKPQADTPRSLSHPIFGVAGLKNSKIPFLSFIYFLFILGFSGFEFSINFFFHDTLYFNPREIGFSFVYMGLIVIFVQGGVIRRISGKVPEKKIALFGTVSLLIGLSILSLSSTFIPVFISLFFLSMGSAFLNPGLSALASLFSGAHEQGKNLGILRGFGSLARAVSPFLFALLYFNYGPNKSFLLSFFLSLLVLGFLLKVPDRENEKQNS